jgi:hypothetical protein
MLTFRRRIALDWWYISIASSNLLEEELACPTLPPSLQLKLPLLPTRLLRPGPLPEDTLSCGSIVGCGETRMRNEQLFSSFTFWCVGRWLQRYVPLRNTQCFSRINDDDYNNNNSSKTTTTTSKHEKKKTPKINQSSDVGRGSRGERRDGGSCLAPSDVAIKVSKRERKYGKNRKTEPQG